MRPACSPGACLISQPLFFNKGLEHFYGSFHDGIVEVIARCVERRAVCAVPDVEYGARDELRIMAEVFRTAGHGLFSGRIAQLCGGPSDFFHAKRVVPGLREFILKLEPDFQTVFLRLLPAQITDCHRMLMRSITGSGAASGVGTAAAVPT